MMHAPVTMDPAPRRTAEAMLNISLQHKMMMKLSPQQVQYLKMLQLPTLALEQKIKAELEMNPLLEEGFEEETEHGPGGTDPRDCGRRRKRRSPARKSPRKKRKKTSTPSTIT